MDIGFWRDISVVLLVLEAFVISLVAGIVVYAIGRGVTYLLREIPGVFTQIHDILTQVNDTVRLITEHIVAPFVAVEQFVARLRGIVAGIRRQVGLR